MTRDSIKEILNRVRIDDILIILTPLVLVVPNIALSISEPYMTVTGRVLNVLLPLSFYLLMLTVTRKVAVATLLALPFMIFAGFQIVLLYLYGPGIIAVDMFLNVATTSFSEVTELLGNLGRAIVTVCLLYLPALILAIISLVRNRRSDSILQPKLRRPAVVATVTLALAAGVYAAASEEYYPDRDLFPVNVSYNLVSAVGRQAQYRDYHRTSSDFKYNATSSSEPDIREVYILVIGETGRADNWSLNGYARNTNPRLSRRDDVVSFDHAMTQSNTTHKSVPMLMTSVTAENFDSIPYRKSIISAFKEAGYHTAYFSNQPPNHSYNQFFGEEADHCAFVPAAGSRRQYDTVLVDSVRKELRDSKTPKIFIVLHTYGSHYLYTDRYPEEESVFRPDSPCDATPSNRERLINAYDNTIVFTDRVLNELIGELESQHCRAALLYASDHGEDIYDDERERFLHASPTPTYNQLHVAMIAWVSPTLAADSPRMYDALRQHRHTPVSPSVSMFDTMLHLANIETPYRDERRSVASARYERPETLYLTDRNTAVPLERSGLTEEDLKLISTIIAEN